MKKLVLNGQQQRVGDAATLLDVVRPLFRAKTGMVIELNGHIIPENRLAEVPLHDNDRIELIQIVGGG